MEKRRMIEIKSSTTEASHTVPAHTQCQRTHSTTNYYYLYFTSLKRALLGFGSFHAKTRSSSPSDIDCRTSLQEWRESERRTRVRLFSLLRCRFILRYVQQRCSTVDTRSIAIATKSRRLQPCPGIACSLCVWEWAWDDTFSIILVTFEPLGGVTGGNFYSKNIIIMGFLWRVCDARIIQKDSCLISA